ncbi:MAG: hypothetical protein JW885_05805 [Deltaproteobacteria bacterium]|nr:hypothetical protein [Candidatus Zymogenaceae bacterium]
MNEQTRNILNLWGNPFYVDWSDPFGDVDALKIFADFVDHSSHDEFPDIMCAIEEVVRHNIPKDTQRYMDTVELATMMYRLLP